MSVYSIIVAAGRGSRAGAEIPKQFVKIAGRPVLRHTTEAILKNTVISGVQVVIHPDDIALYEEAIAGLDDARLMPPVNGGSDRTGSVRAGLTALSEKNCTKVLIHDGARPFVEAEQITQLIEKVAPNKGAFLAVPVIDALWKDKGALSEVSRDNLWRAQTPQAFMYQDILSAFENTDAAANDDVALAVSAGMHVIPVESSERNFKITRPEDFARAERELKDKMDIRTGNAFDVHAFTDGDEVILNGVTIAHDQALLGHSDADVAMHAITDAIFGALCEGDIGQWFPPSEDEWKGAASEIFLEKAIERAETRGFTITHIDCTIICEEPKIGPHCVAMRENLARICKIDADRISVKATTTEQLGFAGRKEGIAAMANATLVKS